MTANLQFVRPSNEPRTSCTDPKWCLLHAVPDDRKSAGQAEMSREEPMENKHETS
jgi:hypothetical protein